MSVGLLAPSEVPVPANQVSPITVFPRLPEIFFVRAKISSVALQDPS
jgi:hypothetical protein